MITYWFDLLSLKVWFVGLTRMVSSPPLRESFARWYRFDRVTNPIPMPEPPVKVDKCRVGPFRTGLQDKCQPWRTKSTADKFQLDAYFFKKHWGVFGQEANLLSPRIELKIPTKKDIQGNVDLGDIGALFAIFGSFSFLPRRWRGRFQRCLWARPATSRRPACRGCWWRHRFECWARRTCWQCSRIGRGRFRCWVPLGQLNRMSWHKNRSNESPWTA